MAKHAYHVVTEEFATKNNGKTKKDKNGHPVDTLSFIKDKKHRYVCSANQCQEFGELFHGLTVEIQYLDSELDFEQPNIDEV